LREAIASVTAIWSGREREPKVGKIFDSDTGQWLPCPQFMEDLSTWASAQGEIWEVFPIGEIWDWWCDIFPDDTAQCSAEKRAVRDGLLDPPIPEHPLSDFMWGSGNLLETSQGHVVPGFNQVRASARVLNIGSTAQGRVYGFLCEGDRLAMKATSVRFKRDGKSLGHTPAPLRWLGKDDPINAQPEELSANVLKRDSLDELFKAARQDPERAKEFVSWQIADLVANLGNSGIEYDEFRGRVQGAVEEYFDGLADEVSSGDFRRLRNDLERAEPGLTEAAYTYRTEKLRHWLINRPAYRSQSGN